MDRLIQLQSFTDSKPIIFIVGNKIDRESRQVSNEEAQASADSFGARYHETSALDSRGVEEFFSQLFNETIAAKLINPTLVDPNKSE